MGFGEYPFILYQFFIDIVKISAEQNTVAPIWKSLTDRICTLKLGTVCLYLHS